MNNKIGIRIDDTDGKVLIQFDRSVEYLEFTPEQGAAFAKAIAERVVKLTPQSPIILMSHH